MLADLVTQLNQRVLSSMREETNQLGGERAAPTPSCCPWPRAATVGSIQANSVLQVDWECFFVTSAAGPPTSTSSPATSARCRPAHSANALITVNPRFPAVDIVRAINQDIDDLSTPTNGLFQALEVTLIYNPVLVGYDMTDAVTGRYACSPSQFMDLLAVRGQDLGPERAGP